MSTPESKIPPDGLSDDEIREILTKMSVVAVVGMSRNKDKPSHRVPMFLLKRGYRIVPVNPSRSEIAGMRSYKSILEIPFDIDIVNVFRPSDEVPEIVEQSAVKGAKVVWLQEGIYHPDAVEIAREAGIKIVWNRCMMKEYRRLIGHYKRGQLKPQGP